MLFKKKKKKITVLTQGKNRTITLQGYILCYDLCKVLKV